MALGLLSSCDEGERFGPQPPVPFPRPALPAPPPPMELERFPVKGIDVSHHQGPIDWKLVGRQPELRFAFIKATQGTRITDARFSQNWAQARRNGLRVGAYHFFTFCEPGEAQAKHFLEVLPKKALALPPVVDLEYWEGCPDLEPEAVRAELEAFLSTVQRGLLRQPLIYASEDSYHRYLEGGDFHYPLWVRSIGAPPTLDAAEWRFWQYGDTGRIEGITGDVDLDLFQGEAAALHRL